MSSDFLKHTAFCLLGTVLLTSLLATRNSSQSNAEGVLRDRLRQRIQERVRERLQQKTIASPNSPSTAGETHTLIQQGIQRSYILYTPAAAVRGTSLPLVIGLHGGRSNPERFAQTTAFNPLANQEGFFVAYPAGINGNWNDGRNSATPPTQDDVGFISALIDDVQRFKKVDSRRIYATGISNGGFMSHRLGCELPHKIVAIASVASTIAVPVAARCKTQKPVPVLMINSPMDAFVPWQGGTVAGGRGGAIVSVLDMLKVWCVNNQCSQQANIQTPQPTVMDGTAITITSRRGLQRNSDVVLVKVEGGGHTWPSGVQQPERLVGKTTQNLNATQFIWNFFKGQTL
jgi:polyhydroxybutyrate depolymerase